MTVLALLDPVTILFVAGWLTFAVELVTVFLRFGLGLQSGVEGARFGRLTRGVRIHHGYVGAALLAAGALVGTTSAMGTALFFAGFALAASDIIHHFLVLWPLTGTPEFHLRYPTPVLVEAKRSNITALTAKVAKNDNAGHDSRSLSPYLASLAVNVVADRCLRRQP